MLVIQHVVTQHCVCCCYNLWMILVCAVCLCGISKITPGSVSPQLDLFKVLCLLLCVVERVLLVVKRCSFWSLLTILQ